MIYNTKISLPLYKVIYPILFICFLAILRPVVYIEEIGSGMDANVALLAIIFFSDIFYMEKQLNTLEVFSLMPPDKQYKNIFQRIVIHFVFLIVLILCEFWMFFIHHPNKISNSNILIIYLEAVFACICSILLWGMISFTFVNLFKNIWIGAGMTLVLWLFASSKQGRMLPTIINIFAYGVRNITVSSDKDWYPGKVTGIILAVILIVLNKKIIYKNNILSPLKKGWKIK